VRRLGDVKFLQGWADDVDFDRKVVRVEENHVDDLSTKKVLPAPDATKGTKSSDVIVENPELPKGPVDEVPYDKLVIAVGAYSQTFGIEGVRQHAHFLRDVGDARRIRVKVLSLFEQCSSPSMCKFSSVVSRRDARKAPRRWARDKETQKATSADPSPPPNSR
jgi:NADH dehydrogenase